MASRPVFLPVDHAPFVRSLQVEFTWNAGLSVSQKQKNVAALHTAYLRRIPNGNVLEISSKSLQELGPKLSAFSLTKYVPSIDKSIPVECAYQGGKVFTLGGPYTDLYVTTPRAAKKDPRLKESGSLKSFTFEGKEIPLFPKTAFYDWLYINALLEHPELTKDLLKFDAFTDIEFNPNKGLACQAKTAAIFVALSRKGLLEKCRDFDSFLSILRSDIS